MTIIGIDPGKKGGIAWIPRRRRIVCTGNPPLLLPNVEPARIAGNVQYGHVPRPLHRERLERFNSEAMNAVNISFCHSGGPLRRIQECAVVTGHPKMAESLVAPSAMQSSQVMAESYQRKINAQCVNNPCVQIRNAYCLRMSNNKRAAINTVSQYLNRGGMSLDLFLLESPAKETEKAIAFPCVKFNSYGNPYNGLAWLPKSQLTKVENDFYTTGPKEMFLCPGWLYSKNFSGGEILV